MTQRKHKVPAFITNKPAEDKKGLMDRFIVWKAEEIIVPIVVKWLQKKVDDLVKADEKLICENEFQYTIALAKSLERRAVLREMIKIFD